MSSTAILFLGFALLLAGFGLPFLMVIRVIEPGFVLSLLGYFSSVIGLVLTLYGLFEHGASRKRRRRWNSSPQVDEPS